MNPALFDQANRTFTKPVDWPLESQCGDLRAFQDDRQIISLWEPSLRERLSVLIFGRVWLRIVSQTQPPVAVEAKRTVFQAP